MDKPLHEALHDVRTSLDHIEDSPDKAILISIGLIAVSLGRIAGSLEAIERHLTAPVDTLSPTFRIQERLTQSVEHFVENRLHTVR